MRTNHASRAVALTFCVKRLTASLLLIGLVASPSLAGLKFVGTPNQASYNAGGAAAGNLALSVDLDAMPTGSIQFVTGPALSVAPITFSFVPQAGASGPAPTIQSTSVNAAGGWNSVIALTTNTFTAFNFNPHALPPNALVGQLNFALPDISTNGMFDLVASAFALDGVDFTAQAIGKVNVVGVPEPSSSLFLGLVGSIAGVQILRRRKQSEANEPANTEAAV